MKRTIINCLLIIFLFQAYAESGKKIASLAKDEYLDYSYDQNEDTLIIYKINNSCKQIYYENENALWGGYQISEDKKAMIFWEFISGRNKPLYYLDGIRGEISFISQLPLNARMDATGNYLMYEQVYKSGIFIVKNLKTGKIEKELKWNIKNKDKWTSRGGTFTILRAAKNDEYDYIFLFRLESRTIAKAFFNISSNKIFIEFDDSDLSEIELRKAEDYQSEFTGWY